MVIYFRPTSASWQAVMSSATARAPSSVVGARSIRPEASRETPLVCIPQYVEGFIFTIVELPGYIL
jgi:hypothetical protein